MDILLALGSSAEYAIVPHFKIQPGILDFIMASRPVLEISAEVGSGLVPIIGTANCLSALKMQYSILPLAAPLASSIRLKVVRPTRDPLAHVVRLSVSDLVPVVAPPASSFGVAA